MIDGNSKMAFVYGASNSMTPEHMLMFVDIASDTSKLFQNAVQANTVPLALSQLHKLKQDVAEKQIELNNILFTITERKSSLRSRREGDLVSEFKRRLSKSGRAGSDKVLETQEVVPLDDVALK